MGGINKAFKAEKAREELLRELVARRVLSLGSLKTGSALGELVDESDIDKWASEPEPNVDLQRGLPFYFLNIDKLVESTCSEWAFEIWSFVSW